MVQNAASLVIAAVVLGEDVDVVYYVLLFLLQCLNCYRREHVRNYLI